MNQQEKERLALSAGIALVLYVALFLVTAWLDILNPRQARKYYGPLMVEVSLAPSVEPRSILPPLEDEAPVEESTMPDFVEEESVEVPEEPPVEEPPVEEAVEQPIDEPVEEPIDRRIVQEEETPAEETIVVIVEEPEEPIEEPVVGEPETPEEPLADALEEEPLVVVADQPAEEPVDKAIVIREEPPPDEAAPVDIEPVQTSEVAETSRSEKPAIENETRVVEETTDQEGSAEDTAQAVPLREERTVFGNSESVSFDEAIQGVDEYQSPREDIPTDQRGSSEIVYGDEEQTETTSEESEPSGGETQTQASGFLGDLAAIDRALARADSDAQGIDVAILASDGPDRVPDDAGDFLVVEDVDELEGERAILKRVDPDLPAGALPEGLRSLSVPVQFIILETGLVSEVRVEDTGDPVLNTRIEQAIRQWKFAPISTDSTVTVRLRYLITAK